MQRHGPRDAISHPRRRPLGPPSQALLSILAAITPTASAPPPTPDFLCPSLIPLRKRERRSSSSSSSATRASPTSSTSASTSSSPFPVKYEQSADGSWYPAVSWSLHGQTRQTPPTASIPRPFPLPLPSGHPRPGIDSVDDVAILPSPSTSTAMPTEFTESLPTGWKPMPSRTKFYSIPLIVVFSLVLALSITLVLAGTVLWTKNRTASRKRRKNSNGERGHNHDSEDDEVIAAAKRAMNRAENGIKKKDRMWARWRRDALRRRRPRRPRDHDAAAPAAASEPAPEPAAPAPAPPAPTPPRVPSPAPTPRDDAPSPAPTVHSPPAYARRSRVAPTKPPDADPDHPHAPFPFDPSRLNPHHPSHPRNRHALSLARSRSLSASTSSSSSSSPPPSPRSASPVPATAHVATDDKAVLARLHGRASAPSLSSPHETEAQAPEWHDERIEDFAGPSSPPPPPQTSTALPPPPPSKATDAGAGAAYPGLPYYVGVGGEGDTEEALRPSAPPQFGQEEAQARPSAPPFGERGGEGDGEGVASAPPFEGAEPSAPPFEGRAGAPPFERRPSAPSFDGHGDVAPSEDERGRTEGGTSEGIGVHAPGRGRTSVLPRYSP